MFLLPWLSVNWGIPTNIVEGREQKCWKMAPGPDRAKKRSRTYYGIGQAMAEQWG